MKMPPLELWAILAAGLGFLFTFFFQLKSAIKDIVEATRTENEELRKSKITTSAGWITAACVLVVSAKSILAFWMAHIQLM